MSEGEATRWRRGAAVDPRGRRRGARGAVSIDGGFDAAQAVVTRLFGETIASTTTDSWRKDAKTELQEWLQARHVPGAELPHRRHARAGACQTFEVECEVPSLQWRATARASRGARPNSPRRSDLLDRIKAGELAVPARKGSSSV
jgi:ribonuclease-3